MSVLVYIDTINGSVSKAAHEAVYYGSKLGTVTVLTNGTIASDKLAELGNYGATKVLVHRGITSQDSSQLSKLVAEQAKSLNATAIVFSQDLTGRAVAPRVAAALKAGLVAGAISLPENGIYKVNVFSGKAIGNVKVNSSVAVINLTPNSISPEAGSGSANVEEINTDCGSPAYTVKSVEKQEGEVLLPEA